MPKGCVSQRSLIAGKVLDCLICKSKFSPTCLSEFRSGQCKACWSVSIFKDGTEEKRPWRLIPKGLYRDASGFRRKFLCKGCGCQLDIRYTVGSAPQKYCSNSCKIKTYTSAYLAKRGQVMCKVCNANPIVKTGGSCKNGRCGHCLYHAPKQCSVCLSEYTEAQFFDKYKRRSCGVCSGSCAAERMRRREAAVKNENPELWKQRRDSLRAAKRAWDTEQRKERTNRYIGLVLRRRLSDALFWCGGEKLGSFLDLLGCTWLEARAHIESQFKPGMSWDNYGKDWEIDHIRPFISFSNLAKSKEQQREACHYTNLQPLFIDEHQAKTTQDLWEAKQRRRQTVPC